MNLRNDSLGTNAGSQFLSRADFSKGGWSCAEAKTMR
nr:MAG TPA: hypothetical protein [Caudoviricetes sp.]